MLRRLIVNADDYGYTPGVSRGILEAHLSGIVTSTSVMGNGEYAAQAVTEALEQAPELGMGLHIVLTAGTPVSDPAAIPALVTPTGAFHPRPDYFRRIADVPIEQIETEIRAQVARFQAIAGRNPDHLDSHHHSTYATAASLDAMLTVAIELNVPIRYPFPSDADYAAEEMIRLGMVDAPNEAVNRIEAVQSLLAATPIKMPDHFFASFYGAGNVTLGDLLNRLMDMPEGQSELMCHPAFVDHTLRAQSAYVDEREQEAESLMHPSARELCASQFIQLITFPELV